MISFEDKALDQLFQWGKDDRKIHEKIRRLIDEIRRDPFHGTDKPEPLKGDLSGKWSRRITEEHRLVYKVSSDQTVIISCKNHY